MADQLLGFKHSKGEFQGRSYDFVTLYLLGRMSQDDNQRGSAGYEMRAEPSIKESLQKINFNGPIDVELQIEKRPTGKGQFVDTVVNVKTLKPAGVI